MHHNESSRIWTAKILIIIIAQSFIQFIKYWIIYLFNLFLQNTWFNTVIKTLSSITKFFHNDKVFSFCTKYSASFRIELCSCRYWYHQWIPPSWYPWFKCFNSFLEPGKHALSYNNRPYNLYMILLCCHVLMYHFYRKLL